jgi:heme-degrading monooxygenase HmoA
MIAVIFEVVPNETQTHVYFDIAATLKPLLEEVAGFISVERFQSVSEPGKYLSLSFWEDEQSIQQWRNVEMHRMAQASGRESVFKDYRLRIAAVTRDYGMFDRKEAPGDSKQFHTAK